VKFWRATSLAEAVCQYTMPPKVRAASPRYFGKAADRSATDEPSQAIANATESNILPLDI